MAVAMQQTTGDEIFDGDWNPDAWWTTTNFAEAIPGVLTPLNWAIWGVRGELATRRAFYDIGAYAKSEAVVAEAQRDRSFGLFHGRFACRLDFLTGLGDRMPGTTGEAVAEQLIGALPPDLTTAPTRRRWPFIAARLPVAFAAAPRRLERLAGETRTFWEAEIARTPLLDLAGARAQFDRAMRQFERVIFRHVQALMCAVSPAHEQVCKLAESAGNRELADRLLAGQGSHAELEVVEDLWRLSRGELSLETFLSRHGYHGPAEGEVASVVWREAPAPVIAMAEQYRTVPESDRPDAVAQRRSQERVEATRELLARLPRTKRPVAKLVLRLADRYIPLRGVGKASFLQGMDVARAAARRIGVHMHQAGTLADPEDAFYLTHEELVGAETPGSLREIVAARRARRAELQELELPSSWRGRPEPVPIAVDSDAAQTDEPLTGVGVSAGIVEGPVRVIHDPTFEDVEPGEILVATTTDPSWAPVMFTAEALVVDIGGPLSHAAVVARELGIPCVMGTANGTKRLRTGDRCRVDGRAGTVEILERAK